MPRGKIRNIILRDKSTRFGIIISCAKIVELSFGIVIITTVTDGINGTNLGFGIVYNRMVAPCVIDITGMECPLGIIDVRDIAKYILAEQIYRAVVLDTRDTVIATIDGRRILIISLFTRNVK